MIGRIELNVPNAKKSQKIERTLKPELLHDGRGQSLPLSAHQASDAARSRTLSNFGAGTYASVASI